jgi:hypothetical protein
MTPARLNARWIRSTTLGLLAMATGTTLTAVAWSQNQPAVLPPAIRACIAEADGQRRLDCYDREVAKLLMPPDRSAANPAAAPPAMAPAAAAPAPAIPTAAVPTPPAPAAAAAPAAPQHYAGHVTHVAFGGDRIVIQLDNGQTWEQAVSDNTDLSLRKGDAVQIDHQLGSWWMTNRNGQSLQVRLIK